jgi:hypothetical protein
MRILGMSRHLDMYGFGVCISSGGRRFLSQSPAFGQVNSSSDMPATCRPTTCSCYNIVPTRWQFIADCRFLSLVQISLDRTALERTSNVFVSAALRVVRPLFRAKDCSANATLEIPEDIRFTSLSIMLAQPCELLALSCALKIAVQNVKRPPLKLQNSSSALGIAVLRRCLAERAEKEGRLHTGMGSAARILSKRDFAR